MVSWYDRYERCVGQLVSWSGGQLVSWSGGFYRCDGCDRYDGYGRCDWCELEVELVETGRLVGFWFFKSC